MQRIHWLFATSLIVVAMGCGKSSDQSASGQSNFLMGTHAQAAQVSNDGTPEKAVFEFLDAIRVGNDRRAAEMLTPLARKEAAENELVIAPPGSPTAKFTVDKVEYVTADKEVAHVASTWSDVTGEAGQLRTDQFVWVLRKEPEGWRIGGTITNVIPGQPSLILNFEDAADMLRKLEMLRQPAQAASEGQGEQVQPEAARTIPNQPMTR